MILHFSSIACTFRFMYAFVLFALGQISSFIYLDHIKGTLCCGRFSSDLLATWCPSLLQAQKWIIAAKLQLSLVHNLLCCLYIIYCLYSAIVSNNLENYIWRSYTEACILSLVSVLQFMYIYALFTGYISSLCPSLLLLVVDVL